MSPPTVTWDMPEDKNLGIATGDLKDRVLVGNPNFQAIPLAELQIQGYQRNWSTEQSDRIAMNFSMEAFGNLHVLRNGPHSYEILDGQHRYMALMRMGYDPVTTLVVCQVFEAEGEYQPNAPAIFVGLNTNRRPLRPIERLRAREAAGDEKALELIRLIESNGLTLWTGTGRVPEGHVGALVTIERLLARDGYEFIDYVFKTIKGAWGDDSRAWRAEIMVGMRHFLRHYQGRIHDDHLHDMLTENDPGTLLRRGQAIAESMGGSRLEYGVARGVAALYNEKLPRSSEIRRLPPWEVGSSRIRNVDREELRRKAQNIGRDTSAGTGALWTSPRSGLHPAQRPEAPPPQE